MSEIGLIFDHNLHCVTCWANPLAAFSFRVPVQCWINSYNVTPVEVPFGGFKASGIGKVCEEFIMQAGKNCAARAGHQFFYHNFHLITTGKRPREHRAVYAVEKRLRRHVGRSARILIVKGVKSTAPGHFSNWQMG
jgi:hypothetical protein